VTFLLHWTSEKIRQHLIMFVLLLDAGNKSTVSPRSVSPNPSSAATVIGTSGAGAAKAKEKAQHFGPFPKGRKGLVEKSSLIRHSPSKSRQEELQRMQSAERSTTNSENQAFLKDVSADLSEILSPVSFPHFLHLIECTAILLSTLFYLFHDQINHRAYNLKLISLGNLKYIT
jgi:hypothetical protein